MKKIFLRIIRSCLIALLLNTAAAEQVRVSIGESIQAALDTAVPGDTVIVEAGTYQEDSNTRYGLHVTTDNLTLMGEGGAVRILATGSQQTGLYAAPPGCEFTESACEAPELEQFVVQGISVENFPRNGIQTRWVNGFLIKNCSSIDNLNNGLYPTLSSNGRVESCFSSGSLDSALWVAGSQNVTVIKNELTQAPTGLEITVSNQVFCSENKVHDNTVGVGLYHANMAGNPPRGDMKDWIIENNTIYNNNLVNSAPAGSFQAALIPGFGVFLVGVGDHTIRGNTIQNNTAAGIVVAGFCTAVSLSPLPDCSQEPPITGEASADRNVVSDNVLIDNAASPPAFLPQGDIVYLQLNPSPDYPEEGDENCFEGNTDPDGFTFFSSEADGELPTGGCVFNGDSLAPSPMLLDLDTSAPTSSPSSTLSSIMKPTEVQTTSGAFKKLSVVTWIVVLGLVSTVCFL